MSTTPAAVNAQTPASAPSSLSAESAARLGSRKPVAALMPRRNDTLQPGDQVKVTLDATDGKTMTVTWGAGAKSGDRAPWLFVPFDGLPANGTRDMSRIYSTTYVAIKFLTGSPEQTGISFWDDREQNGNLVYVKDGIFDAGENTWYVPMDTASNLRLDRVRGIAIGQEGNKAPVRLQIELPVRLISTGRKDNRPLTYPKLPAIVHVTLDADKITKDLADFGFGCHWDFCEGMTEGGDSRIGSGDKYKVPLAHYKALGFNMVRTSGTLASPYDEKAVREFKTRTNRQGWDQLAPITVQEQMALHRQASFEQMAMILPYNAYYDLPAATRPTIQEWAKDIPENARMAKGQGPFRRRYYELGNEIWAINRDKGGESKVIYGKLPGDLDWYAQQIKKQDPEAKIMASFGGYETSWPALMRSLDNLDVLNVSNYGWQTTYERQRTYREAQWVDEAQEKLRAADPKAAERIRFGVTEYAPHEWSNTWNNTSDLGHALWAFDKAIGGLAHPRIAFEIQWTWRWLWQHYSRLDKRDVTVPYDVYPAAGFDLVTSENRLSAQGKAVQLIGRNRLDQVVATTCDGQGAVVAVAVRSRDGKQVNLFILNKDYDSKIIKLNLGTLRPVSVVQQVFTGNGLQDPEPTLVRVKAVPQFKVGAAELSLPETSITLLTFRQ
ncbi:MAG: hypothetical protein H7Z41_04735 [Cytophagales bacterium]|nr:hypothetical protein [Armatimonadota bacterium]